jgi:protein involved in polysaccharide export with SLBB domain
MAKLAALLITLALLCIPASAQESGGSTSGAGVPAGTTSSKDGIQFNLSPDVLGLEDFLPSYPLSAGDIININIYSPTLVTIKATVDSNGKVVIPPAGRVYVLGLTVEEAAAKIEAKLAPYYKQVTVGIDFYRLSNVKVLVFGATDRAGVYTMKGGTTMLEFLQQLKLPSWGQYRQIHHYRSKSFFLGNDEAGAKRSGFGEASEVQTPEESVTGLAGDEDAMLAWVKRSNAKDTLVDPTVFVAQGELKSKNFLLRDGDIIYFKLPDKAVTVSGTTRPGVYEVLPGEGLLEVMRAAGEATPENDLRDTVIERMGGDGTLAYQIVDLDKYYFSELAPPEIPLNNGDRVRVIPYDQSVTVIGAVNTAGRIPFDAEFSVLDYIAAAGGGRADAQREKIFIVRGSWRPGGAFELRESIMVNGDEYVGGKLKQLPPVYPGDVIFVPTKDELAKRDLASILTNVTLSALAIFKK